MSATAWVILVGLIMIAAVVIFNSISVIPTVGIGITTRFKKRVKKGNRIKILGEGINIVLPFVDKIEFFSGKLQTKPLAFDVFSRDRLEIKVAGSVQWRPDDLNTFIAMEEKTIIDGMADSIKSELGKISGTKNGDEFIRARRALELFINCALRLKRPPHHWVNPKRDADGKEIQGSVEIDEVSLGEYLDGLSDDLRSKTGDKLGSDKWKLPMINVQEGKKEIFDELSFYDQNITRVSILLEQETALGDRRSPIENIYGVDIAVFRLADVDFSDSTKNALESVRQARAEMEATQQRHDQKVKMIKEYISMGLSEELSINLAEAAMTGKTTVDKKIISFEGLCQLPSLLKGLTGGNNGS